MLGLTGIGALWAGDIQGTVIVTHKLTRRRVTASAGAYERGSPVVLGSGSSGNDALAYERSRLWSFYRGR